MSKINPPAGNLDDLSAVLFATLRDLRDKANPLPLEIATATVHVARELIATHRLELDFMRMVAEDKPKSTFFGSDQDEEQDAPRPAQISQRTTWNGLETVTQVAGGNILQHRIR